MPLTVPLRPHDRVRLFPPGVEEPLRGVDLCTTVFGLHLAYRVSATVRTRHTFDAAATFETHDVAADAWDDSLPTIGSDYRGHLFVGYHDAGAAIIRRSKNFGTDWELVGTLSGAKWPRVRANVWGHLLAVYRAGSIEVYQSLDELATIGSPVVSFAAEAQRPVLWVDPFERVHLVYMESAYLFRRSSIDGHVWDGPATLVLGRKFPAGTATPFWGLYAQWAASSLRLITTREDWEVEDSTEYPLSLGDAYPPQGVGLGADHHGIVWLAAQANDESVRLLRSRDFGLQDWNDA